MYHHHHHCLSPLSRYRSCTNILQPSISWAIWVRSLPFSFVPVGSISVPVVDHFYGVCDQSISNVFVLSHPTLVYVPFFPRLLHFLHPPTLALASPHYNIYISSRQFLQHILQLQFILFLCRIGWGINHHYVHVYSFIVCTKGCS